MHAKIGIIGRVRAFIIADSIMNNGLVVTSASFVVSSGLTIVLIKLPVKGRSIIPERITDTTSIIMIKTLTQPMFDQKFL